MKFNKALKSQNDDLKTEVKKGKKNKKIIDSSTEKFMPAPQAKK